MAYAVFGDIKSEFKDIAIDATSSVTETDVTEFLAQAHELIDGFVGTKYLLPIDAAHTAALKLLKRIEIALVAERVGKILKVKSGVAKADQDSKFTSGKPWALSLLKQIQECSILLLTNGPPRVQLPLVGEGTVVSSFNVEEDIEPVFQKGVDQW